MISHKTKGFDDFNLTKDEFTPMFFGFRLFYKKLTCLWKLEGALKYYNLKVVVDL